jgi:hypothetical protein
MSAPSGYISVAYELERRIERLAEVYPKVLELTDAFDLFKWGLDVGDLDVTLGMACAALARVKFRALSKVGP